MGVVSVSGNNVVLRPTFNGHNVDVIDIPRRGVTLLRIRLNNQSVLFRSQLMLEKLH